MCHDDSMDLGFQIETGKKDVARAKATIADEEAKIGSAEAKIEELSTSIATSTKDLESATAIRAKENEDFQKLEKELMEAVSMLERAYGIIEREMAKTGFIQGKAGQEAMSKVMDALEAVIVSAGVNSADKVKVQALLQATQGDSDSDLALQPGGAPDPAAYKSKSGGILSVLEDMLEKAKAELSSAQKAEMNSAFDFKMLKQKLEDAIAFGKKTLAETKKAKAAAEEAKAVAEGELETASKNLSDDETHLKDLQPECMTSAEEDTESKTSRAEELEALGTAKKILEEKTGAASDRAYSFIQIGTVSKAGTKTKEVKQHVLDLLQSLAKKNNDKQLSLLAQRIQSAAMLGEDPFAKIKGLISEMIEKLEAEAAKEAAHNAFCDKEMSETKAKKEDKETELDDLSTKIDKATSRRRLRRRLRTRLSATRRCRRRRRRRRTRRRSSVKSPRRRRRRRSCARSRPLHGRRRRRTMSRASRALAWRFRCSGIITPRRTILRKSSFRAGWARARASTPRPRAPPRVSSACSRLLRATSPSCSPRATRPRPWPWRSMRSSARTMRSPRRRRRPRPCLRVSRRTRRSP